MQHATNDPKLSSRQQENTADAEWDRSRITLFKNLLLIGTVLCVLDQTHYLIFGGPFFYPTLVLLITFAVLFFLFRQGLHHLARNLLNTALPLIMSASLLLYGADVGAGYTIFVFISTSVVFHNQAQSRIRFILYNTALYSTAFVLLAFIAPPFSMNTGPMEITLTYIGTATCVAALAIFSVREVARHQQHKEQMVQLLHQKNKALRQTQQEIKHFTRITSHDLKSPVRTISSFLDLIKRDIERKEYDRLQEYIAYAKRGSYQLNLLINDIMEYIELYDEHPRPVKPVALSELITQCQEQLSLAHKRKLLITRPLPLPEILSLRRELSILFLNLMENALVYNQSKQPELVITHQEEKDYHLICFKDNGIGISKEFHQRVFNMFQRLHTADFHPGSGLGLALCRKIVQQMNGEIWLKSSEKAGSSFFIRLPKLSATTSGGRPGVARAGNASLTPAVR